jgi:D-alanyl-D-alanine carboxypeptidase
MADGFFKHLWIWLAMYWYRLLFVILLLVLSGTLVAGDDKQTTGLPESVARILAAHKIPEDSLSIFVQEIGQDTPLLSINSATIDGKPRLTLAAA